jgi:hypothetical protein
MRRGLPRQVDANASVICWYPTGKRAGPRCRFDCHEIDSVTAGRSGPGVLAATASRRRLSLRAQLSPRRSLGRPWKACMRGARGGVCGV